MTRVNSGTGLHRKGRRAHNADATIARSRAKGRLVCIPDERMYDDIYLAIVEHSLPPGTKLPEDALADVFGVSRMRIRNVLHQLAHEGMVSLERNRGAFVAKPSTKNAREVFAARRLLETAAVREIAQNSKPEHTKALRAFVAQEREAHERSDHRAMITLSAEFHLKLIGILDNDTLTEFLRALVSRTSLVIAVYERPGASCCHYDEHELLVDRIANKEGSKAAETMRQHLDSIERSLVLEDAATPSINLRQVFAQRAMRRLE